MENRPVCAGVEEMVTATQYGDCEYCEHQVTKGFDVNTRDRDDCTLLHWAAINNRTKLVSYYIEHNAEVNAIGGELKSTPLHWAARQGHMKAVVLLVNYGADMMVTDSEGCLPIHLAVQYGHTAVVAYLISKGCAVECCDRNGIPLLSWATCSGSSTEIFQLLLAMGADVNAKDATFGNTALHWAVLHNNHVAAALLVDNKADVSIKNRQNRTVADFVISRDECVIASVWKECKRRGYCRCSLRERLSFSKGFVRLYYLCYPLAAFLVVAWSMQTSALFITTKLLLLLVVCIILYHGYWLFYCCDTGNALPCGMNVATMICLTFTWLLTVFPSQQHWQSFDFLFLLSAVALNYFLVRAWLIDPGFITSSFAEKCKVIEELVQSEKDFSSLCPKCVVLQPPLTKHCYMCQRCVENFDHHCPWIGNCVGRNNRTLFKHYLIITVASLCFYCLSLTSHLRNACGSWWIVPAFTCSPWPVFTVLMALFHLLWVTGTLCFQFCELFNFFYLFRLTNAENCSKSRTLRNRHLTMFTFHAILFGVSICVIS